MKRRVKIGYSIVAILIVVFLGIVSYNTWKEKGVLLAPTCTDSDGGNILTTKGVVTDGVNIKEDKCLSSTSIIEYTCVNNAIIENPSQNCPSGTKCLADACVNSPYNMYLKFDENSGTHAYDSSGYGNLGWVAAFWTIGKYGTALQFTEAGGHYVSVRDSSSLKSNIFTASAWVNLDSYPTDWRRIVGKSNFDFTNNNGWDIAVINENTVTKLNARIGGSDYLQIMYPKLPVNEWHLVTLTYDGSQAKLYIDDGVGTYRNFDCQGCNSKYAVKNIGKIIPQNTLPLMVGNNNYRSINAKIDEVRYYNKALTQSEISTLFNPTFACVDSDVTSNYLNGVNYNRFGICTQYIEGNTEDHPDVCDEYGKQWEQYCNLDGKTCGYTYHFCDAEKGEVCTRGQCAIKNPKCKELYPGHNNPNANRINLIFVGVGQPSIADVIDKGKRIVDLNHEFFDNPGMQLSGEQPGLAELRVYNDCRNSNDCNMDKFNFWYIDRIYDKIDYSQLDSYFCSANGDEYYQILEYSGVGTGHSTVGSKYSRVNSKSDKWHWIALHEFQHQMGLQDEYIGSGTVSDSDPNCAKDYASAQQKWGDLVGQSTNEFGQSYTVGYWGKGCNTIIPSRCGCANSYDNYRGTYSSIMRDYVYGLGPINQRYIRNVLAQYSVS